MAPQEVSPADRIRELSAINGDVPVLLEAAGNAVKALTNSPLSKTTLGDTDTDMADGSRSSSIEERKETFKEHTEAYFTTLQAILARLRRQAYALEEAGIIAAEAPTLSSGAQERQNVPGSGVQRGHASAAPARDSDRIKNGGLGNLDVGWLNSRGNKVGTEKESELLEEAKQLLDQTLSKGRQPWINDAT